jgi:hypothetical protein
MLLCPKCKQPVVTTDNKDYVICCNEVIFVINVPPDSKNEPET